MRILLTDAGKRFNREWIFRHLNYEFSIGNSYAIIGPNGSGKSTLLQLLSGGMEFSEGTASWQLQNGPIENETVYTQVSICAPYLELIEEMTLLEFLSFHQQFKPFLAGITKEYIIKLMGLERAANKQIRFYSSGMKQRVKLAQAIFSNSLLVLLDEPCSNLDTAGIQLYHKLINEYCQYRLLIISSNEEAEYSFCKNKISVSDYKS